MECLNEDSVVGFVSRTLTKQERADALVHLDACAECLSVVSEMARTDAVSPTPRTVGRYRLVAMVGQGAMGSVYAAYDPQLDRRVAVKVLRADRLSSATAQARLAQEARAMAKLSHPNVVSVFDAGEVEGGVFVTMEFIEGVTLAAWLRQASRSFREIRDVFLAAGRGLVAAHAAGLVHRDFKPENVLIDAGGRAAVTDFGLAARDAAPRVLGGRPDSAFDGALTQSGATVGTPRYMSPEQHARNEVDARSDQFSFAVALYEALYGERPFAGETVEAVRASTLAGLPANAPGRFDSAVPTALRDAIVRALSVTPEERFADLDGLLRPLAAAEPDVSPAKPRRTTRRRARATVLGVVVAVAFAIGVGLSSRWQGPGRGRAIASPATPEAGGAHGERHREAVLVLPTDNRSGSALADDTIDSVLAAAIAPSTRLDPQAGVDLSRLREELAPDARDVGPSLVAALRARGDRGFTVSSSVTAAPPGVHLLVELRAAGSDATIYRADEVCASLDDLVPAALRVGRALRVAMGDPASGDPGDVVTLSSSLAAVHEWSAIRRLNSAGDYASAVTHARAALAADPDFIEGHAQLGLALSNLTRFAEARPELELALESADRLGERRRLTLLGDYYGVLGRSSESIAAYEELLSKWPGDTGAEMNVAAAALDGAEWRIAIELTRRGALHHPRMVVARSNLVLALLGGKRLDEAVTEGERILAEFPRAPRYTYPFVAIGHVLLGDRQGALAAYDRLRAVDAEFADEGLADLAAYEGRLDDAVRLLQGQIDQALARHAPEDALTEYVALADVLLRRGDKRGAAAAARAAVGHGSLRTQYPVAQVLHAVGAHREAQAIADGWGASLAAEWRAHAKLELGDQRRAEGDLAGAIRAYQEGLVSHDVWLGRARLGAAYLEQGNWAEARRELAVCVARASEGAVYGTPSLRLLPRVYLGLAIAKEATTPREALADYEAILEREANAQADPIANEARKRADTLKKKLATPPAPSR